MKKNSEPLADSDDHGERKDEMQEAQKESEVHEVSTNWKSSDILGAAVFNSNSSSQLRESQNANAKQHSSASSTSNLVSKEDEERRGENVGFNAEWEPLSPQQQPPPPQAIGNTGKEVFYSLEDNVKPEVLKNIKKIKGKKKNFAEEYPLLHSHIQMELADDVPICKNNIPVAKAKELEENYMKLERAKIELSRQKTELICCALNLIEDALAKRDAPAKS